jgi:hypothetical protein
MSAPAGAPSLHRGFECRWEESDDTEPRSPVTRAAFSPKPGGRITAHLGDPRCCFQIDGEEKAGVVWGDGGLARGAAAGCDDQWLLDCQFY